MKLSFKSASPQKLLSILIGLHFILLPKAFCQPIPDDEFSLKPPEKKYSYGYYTSIGYLDSRPEHENFGFVHFGPGNKIIPVNFESGLDKKLKDFLKNTVDSLNSNGELLFQLRKLKFSEKQSPGIEAGYCFLRADLYAKQDSTFKKLNRLDTFIVVEEEDVTHALFSESANAITQFILKNLRTDISNTENFTLRQVMHMDSIEKSKIPLYTTDKNSDGVYLNFESFKNQKPDYKIIELVYKDDKLVVIKAQNAKGKTVKTKPEEFFAYVNEGRPFISAQYDCYPLEKINKDFYFKGEAEVPVEQDPGKEEQKGEQSEAKKIKTRIALFQIRLDHIDGTLMRIKEIKK